MSERRKPGDIVTIGNGTRRYRIKDDGAEPWCWHECGDDGCQEWATLWHIDDNGVPSGVVAFHICECEMTTVLPAGSTPDPAP